MYHLHQKYTNELKINNKFIDKKAVIDYFNSLHPAQQMFVINYNNHNKIMEIEDNTENYDDDDEYNEKESNINDLSKSLNNQEIIVD